MWKENNHAGNIRWIRIAVGLISLVTGLVFVSVVSVVAVLFIRGSMWSFAEEFNRSHRYQHLSVNSEGKETSRDEISLKQKISEEEYLSYQDSEGTHHLISNFGMNEYKCTVTCRCGGKESVGRRSTTVLGRFFVLVAATTAAMVLKPEDYPTIDEENFCKDWENKSYEELCDEEIILADVEDCERVEEIEYDEERIKQKPFYCSGNCLAQVFDPDERGRKNSKKLNNKANKYGCEELRLERVWRNYIGIEEEQEMIDEGLVDSRESYVEKMFSITDLDEYCNKESYTLMKQAYMGAVCFCVGFNEGKNEEGEMNMESPGNPTVKCVEITEEEANTKETVMIKKSQEL